jgi:hypothetical protein
MTARISTLVLVLVAACGGGGSGTDAPPPPIDATAATPDATLQVEVCDPAAGPFSLTIDNPYFPLPVGRHLVLDGMEGATVVHLEITVQDLTEDVAGVTTRVLEERESADGELVEVSRNFFAQAPDGTVCYFGEDVDIYEGGVIVGHDSAWRADGADNRPGIMMPPAPAIGVSYPQEVAPGIAEDMAEIVGIGESLTVPAGTFTDTVRTDEWTPLEPGVVEGKWYVRDVGLTVDDTLNLTSFQ